MSNPTNWLCVGLVAILLVSFLLDEIADFINKIRRGR